MEIVSVPLLMGIVYTLVTLLKFAFKKFTSFVNFVPLISGILGVIISIISFYAIPSIMLTQNVIQAIIFGLTHGLSAVGMEQIVVQMKQLSVNTQTKAVEEGTKVEKDLTIIDTMDSTAKDTSQIVSNDDKILTDKDQGNIQEKTVELKDNNTTNESTK